ncbi:MAG TPA: hypothetical protein VFZ00_13715 [Solirubrobacter sp.]|nr:hypothetical protein [Solirubrobacter sp.]
MSTLELADRLTEETGRRGFLAKAGAAALAAASAVLVTTAEDAQALNFWHCCCFCTEPVGSCSYDCAWCWLGCCHQNPGGGSKHQTYCCEGYTSCAVATGGCGTGWICSFYGSTVNNNCATNHSPGVCPCGVGCCCDHTG